MTKTREIIQNLLTEMAKDNYVNEEDKRRNDEFMFCFRNCYTEMETMSHMTNKIPSLNPEVVMLSFDMYMDMIPDKESREAYYKKAAECAKARARDKKDQVEASNAKPFTSD